MLTFAVLALLAAVEAPEPQSAGEVKLPLRDYVALVEKVEAAEAARIAARTNVEPRVAEVVAQRVVLTLNEGGADLNASYEVEIRGPVERAVALPFGGLAHRITLDPPGTTAAVAKTEGVLLLVATRPGRYRVAVSGKALLQQDGGAESVGLAPMRAPVAEVEVSLPAGRAWRCPGAIVAEEAVKEGRRLLRLALPRGQGGTFETRRDVRPVEPPKPLATAVVVTVVALGREGPRRHDIVLYEVARGELAAMTLTLPTGLEPERVVTDEGEATPWVEGRELRVERAKRLTGSGYVALVSQPTARESLPLAPVAVDTKVRARYLAVASDVAAALTPTPEGQWTRVDLSDLPAPVFQVAESLGLVAAWRQRRDDVPGQLQVTTMPAPQRLEGLVRSRRSLTLLTVEGTLLHRDRFTVEGAGAAFELGLPAAGTLWSASVNDVPVRPLEKDGRTVIPLGLSADEAVTIETVVVQERGVPPGRAELSLGLPEVVTPVLHHEWRLLLPERNRYRFLDGDLEPPRAAPPERERESRKRRGPRAFAAGVGGKSTLSGVVTDETGNVVPGATVVLTSHWDQRALRLQSDEAGEFSFLFLPAGRYTLQCSMAGFKTAQYQIPVGSSESLDYEIELSVGDIVETISVTRDALPRRRGREERDTSDKEDEADELRREYAAELAPLKQGLVGGVKPLPVEIPESGKVLVLTGVLPPARVSARLATKAPKD